MLEEEDFKSFLITKINLSDDSKELVKIYNENTSFSFEILHKLLSLKDYSEFLTIWNLSYSNLKNNPSELKKINFTSKEIREISESKIVDNFLGSLLDMAIHYDNSFESFKICLLISEIIQTKKQFPSKSWIITYFTLLSNFFKSNNLFLAYLNTLNILKEHQSIQITRKEFDFYVKVEKIKNESTSKDLFCGLKLKDIDSLSFDFIEEEFSYESIWDEIFSLKVKNTIENLSFIMKNGFKFNIENEIINIEPGSSVKFVSRIFEIANSYRIIPKSQPLEEEVTVKPVEKIEQKISIPVQKEEKITIKKPEFKNRFSNLYKKFKLLHKYSNIQFEDLHFEGRNQLRNEKIKEAKETLDKEKEKLSKYATIIPDLKLELKNKIDIKKVEEEAKEKERVKAEEEKALAERKSSMWRNKSSVEPKSESTTPLYNPTSSESMSRTQQSENKGIYKPNLSSINSMIKNYKSENQPKSEEKPTRSEGSWRARPSKEQNQDSSK